jgi:hypothetical protein
MLYDVCHVVVHQRNLAFSLHVESQTEVVVCVRLVYLRVLEFIISEWYFCFVSSKLLNVVKLLFFILAVFVDQK